MNAYATVLLPMVLGMVAASSIACRKGPPPAVPLQEAECTEGFAEWGLAENGFFGTSPENGLEIWTWDGSSPKGQPGVRIRRATHVIPLANGSYLACESPRVPDTSWPLVIRHPASPDPVREWAPPLHWGYRDIGISRSRKFAPLILKEDLGDPPPGYNWRNPRLRIGLVDVDSLDLRWVLEHRGEVYGDIRQITSSDDGKYIALAGWNNGIALVDAEAKAIKWTKKPAGSVSFGYALFSSDGLTLYAADAGGGCVYAFETQTGNVIRQCYATETGQSIYGHRISCLAISPDENWIAAGTGPEGQVFLMSTAPSGGKPTLLPHGLSTIRIVSFSPDSKYLASVAAGKIKVWAVSTTTL